MNRSLQWKLIAGFILVFIAGDKTAGQLAEIRKETGRRVHEIIIGAHREMAANLTDDQRLKLQEIEARHRHWQRFRDSRPRPSASPESSAQPP